MFNFIFFIIPERMWGMGEGDDVMMTG